MKLRKAIEKSVRAFYDGDLPDEAIAASEEEYIYTLEYLEDVFKEQGEAPEITDEEDLDEV